MTGLSGRCSPTNAQLYALTPTGLWLRETLTTVFGIDEHLESVGAEAIYTRVEEQLASRLLHHMRCSIDSGSNGLSTTDAAGSSLADHRAIAESASRFPRPGRRSGPTRSWPSTRPVGATPLSELEAAADREVLDYQGFIEVLGERRLAFKELGATATDHAADERGHDPAEPRERPQALFALALAGKRLRGRGKALRGAHAQLSSRG